jgi:hypothetical protein
MEGSILEKELNPAPQAFAHGSYAHSEDLQSSPVQVTAVA